MLTRRHLLMTTAIALMPVSHLPFGSKQAAAAEVPLMRSDAEWRRLLTQAQYEVLRQSATEAPYSSPLLQEHRNGVFACAGCDRGLFSSETKFESGTGWPSFWAPLDDKAVGVERDSSLGMVRTAVHCANCGGHLGHVFNDGPRVTGLRYCMNGIALRFKPAGAGGAGR